MFNAWGYGVYYFFASLMLLSIAFVYFLIPETKSIPLEKMDRLFEIKPASQANRIIMEELQGVDFQRPDGESDAERTAGSIKQADAGKYSSS